MSDRRTVTETVFDDAPDKIPVEGSGCEMPLITFIEWLEDRWAEVPKEHADSVKIDIGTHREYGEDYANVRITYTRPETDEEVAMREADQAARYAAREADERRQFEALQRKYGAPT